MVQKKKKLQESFVLSCHWDVKQLLQAVGFAHGLAVTGTPLCMGLCGRSTGRESWAFLPAGTPLLPTETQEAWVTRVRAQHLLRSPAPAAKHASTSQMRAPSLGSEDDPHWRVQFSSITSDTVNALCQLQTQEAAGLAGTTRTSWSSVCWIPLYNTPMKECPDFPCMPSGMGASLLPCVSLSVLR